jgi:hypothetical protein
VEEVSAGLLRATAGEDGPSNDGLEDENMNDTSSSPSIGEAGWVRRSPSFAVASNVGSELVSAVLGM